MATYIGLDGIKGGWVAAWIEDDGSHYFDYGNLDRLLSIRFVRAMIDIPIGLPDKGNRSCDLQAHKLVGSSVFLGVRRSLLAFDDYNSANTFYQQNGEKKIAKQLWCIRNKIGEVDEFVSRNKNMPIYETHPELLFWSLAGKQKLASKKTTEGMQQRLEVLRKIGFSKIEKWTEWLARTGIKVDDLCDACVCAVAARDARNILGNGDLDSRGLRMEMHY